MPDSVPASYLRVLVALAEFYVLVRPQLQQLVFPTHKQSRFARKALNELARGALIGKTRRTITYDGNRAGCPVYFLTAEGRERLCEWTGCESYLAASVARPRDDRLEHWTAIAEWQLRMRAALDRQDCVLMPTWVNEWNKYRADAAGANEYFLHVQFAGEKKLSCSPDLAFVLETQGQSRAYYGEADLGSSSVEQVIARKHQGYDLLARTLMHRTRHFPEVTAEDCRVLVVTTSRWRRDRMAKLVVGKPGAHRWRFAAWEDFQPESLLHEPIWIDAHGQFVPLAAPPADYQPLAASYARPQRPIASKGHAMVTAEQGGDDNEH
jgi:hypothetical protein